MRSSSALIVGLVAGAASGATSAFVVTTLTRGVDDAPPPISAAGADSELARSVAALRAEVEAVGTKVAGLELSRPTALPRTEIGRADESQELEEVRELLAALKTPNAPPPPQITALVDRALEDRAAREEAEEAARREQQLLERVDRRVESLATELGLDARQSKSMRDTLLAFEQKRGAMFEDLRSGGANLDRETLRSTFEEMRNGFHGELQTFLTPAQLDLYKERNDDLFGRGGGPGAFGGPPGGGGDRGGRSRGGS